MDQRSCSRVVCCQGTIQLATAIHALSFREKQNASASGTIFKNFLIVHDLFTTADQQIMFFDVIKKMAESVLAWEAIVYLDPATITRLDDIYSTKGEMQFSMEMEKFLKVGNADEVYASRNWQKGSTMLLNYFSESYKISYGDSIGLFFPESYFSDNDWRTRLRLSGFGQRTFALKDKLKVATQYPGRRPLLKYFETQRFDYGYFCFPSISGEGPNFKYETIDVSDLKGTFEEFVGQMSIDVPRELEGGEPFCGLLTSNFSEAERMSLHDEIDAYVSFVNDHKEKYNVLLIKPHPRDSKEKIQLLKTRFLDDFKTVIVLDDPVHFYIPFEFFLIKFERGKPGMLQKSRFFTVSSSCLSFWFLFGISPYIGIGERLVRKYFRPDQVQNRLDHEDDLRRLVGTA